MNHLSRASHEETRRLQVRLAEGRYTEMKVSGVHKGGGGGKGGVGN